ncbi:MAG: hypothetical protein ACE5L6_06650 [Candidatus Bathyarchaeia archaeon]
MNQTKLTVLIQFLNSFISGVLTIALPLLMKERNIDIVIIGLIFACLPLIFQLTRMLFAIISDFLGRKLFFVLNGFLSILSGSVYYLAYTPTVSPRQAHGGNEECFPLGSEQSLPSGGER